MRITSINKNPQPSYPSSIPANNSIGQPSNMNMNRNKKIIIDRLYKNNKNKLNANPEENHNVENSSREMFSNKLVEITNVRRMQRTEGSTQENINKSKMNANLKDIQVSQFTLNKSLSNNFMIPEQSILLSEYNKKSISNEIQVQPRSTAETFRCSKNQQKQQYDPNERIQNTMKQFDLKFMVKYEAVNLVNRNKTNRSLLKEIYQIAKTKYRKSINNSNVYQNYRNNSDNTLLQTAYFRQSINNISNYNSICNKMDNNITYNMSNQHPNNNLITVNNIDLNNNGITENAQNSNNKYEYNNKYYVVRRTKTEVSFDCKEKEEISNMDNNRIYSHSNRYLRPIPRVQTQRNNLQDKQKQNYENNQGYDNKIRPIGMIRRQNSQRDLRIQSNVNNNEQNSKKIGINVISNSINLRNEPKLSINLNSKQNSQQKLRIIRQQLHQIYNSRNKCHSTTNSNNSKASKSYEQINSNYNSINNNMNNNNSKYNGGRQNMQDYYRAYLMQHRNHHHNQSHRLLIRYDPQ